jgi:type II secretory pathway pseudopilin PulG
MQDQRPDKLLNILACLSVPLVVLIILAAVLLMPVLAVAQETRTDARATTNSTQSDRYEKKTYADQNGTQELTRTLETEHHVTSDGEVEIQRYRAPAWEGDDKVSWEREVRTRKLPDGTVEKEDVLRTPDGAGQLAPVEIIREKTTLGRDSTVVQREILGRRGGEDLQAVQKEQITEKGPDNAKQVFKEVQRLDTATRQWQTIERETSLTSTSKVGDSIQKETKSVRQTPDASGGLTDFERRQERTVSGDGRETHESTVYSRDMSTTESGHFLLLDHTTTEVRTVEPGNTTRHVVRESDLLFGNSELNLNSRHPEVIEEQTTVERTAPDGSTQTVTKVSGRTASEPSAVRPVYTLVEETDRAGYVRRIYIPAQ